MPLDVGNIPPVEAGIVVVEKCPAIDHRSWFYETPEGLYHLDRFWAGERDGVPTVVTMEEVFPHRRNR